MPTDREVLEKARHHLACLEGSAESEQWREPVQSVIGLIDAHLRKPLESSSMFRLDSWSVASAVAVVVAMVLFSRAYPESTGVPQIMAVVGVGLVTGLGMVLVQAVATVLWNTARERKS